MLRFLVRLFMQGLMPSFFGIGMGASKGEKQATHDLTQLGGFATGQGEGAISKVLQWDNALLSGDMGKVAQLLAPYNNALNKQASQQKLTTAQFGTRSGGTAATSGAIDDSVRTNESDMIANLISSAKGEEASLGSSLLTTGASADESRFNMEKTMQEQNAAKIGDIFGSAFSIAGAAGGIAGAGGDWEKILKSIGGIG